MMNRPSLRIGEMANLAGVKSDTIRFYEKRGLLPKPPRAASGYRAYDECSLRQLRFIKQAQALGFSLDEIKRILNLRGRGGETCRCVINIAEATLAETEQKLRELQEFHNRLQQALTAWKRSAARRRDSHAEFCALIESTARPLRQPEPFVMSQRAAH